MQKSLNSFFKRKAPESKDNAGQPTKKRKGPARFRGTFLPDGWRNGSGDFRDSVIYNRPPEPSTYTKVAAFDFDDTLVVGTFGRSGGGSGTVTMKFPTVVEKLRSLHSQGYRIVIFTNEATIGRAKKPEAIHRAVLRKTDRLNDFKRRVGVPVDIFVATASDANRKLSTKDVRDKGLRGGSGMWRLLCELSSQESAAPIVADSLYVGDAAGRARDHSDCDKRFAELVGLQFSTEDTFFGLPRKAAPFDELTDVVKRLSGFQTMLVLVGPPGVGKSTLAAAIVSANGSGNAWTTVCQDNLGSIDQCLELATAELQAGRSVIIDRTNVNPNQRLNWTRLARQSQTACVAVCFDEMATDELVQRCLCRSDHPTLGTSKKSKAQIRQVVDSMQRRYVPIYSPGEEGFHAIVQVDANSARSAPAELSRLATAKPALEEPGETKNSAAGAESVELPTVLVLPPRIASLGSVNQAAWEKSALDLGKWVASAAPAGIAKAVHVVYDAGDIPNAAGFEEKFRAGLGPAQASSERIRITVVSGYEELRALVDVRSRTFVITPCELGFRRSRSKIGSHVDSLFQSTLGSRLQDVARSKHECCQVGSVYVTQCGCTRLQMWQFRAAGTNASADELEAGVAVVYSKLAEMLKSRASPPARAATSVLQIIQTMKLPSSYTPPDGRPSRVGDFRRALDQYVVPPLSPEAASRVYLETPEAVVIYDGYPKAARHLLVIPRPDFLTRSAASQLVAPDDAYAVTVLHTIARRVASHLKEGLGSEDNVVCGYHEKPSLARLHIHIISTDYSSPWMKTKKHRDSFMTSFFQPLELVETRLGM